MTVPIVCFVGKSSSGKTTFLEKLVPELAGRGYRLGIVKHDVHGFDLDQPGKDTYRLREAGAWRVAISSPERFAVIGRVEEELPLPKLVGRYLGDVDLVIAEGYKRSDQLKIELCRAARSQELICAPEELLAVVSDLHFDVPCPQFSLDDVAGVADFLQERFLRPREAAAPATLVSLRVDGREIPLKPFVQEMLAGMVRGLIGGLREVEGEQVELRIGREGVRREDVKREDVKREDVKRDP